MTPADDVIARAARMLAPYAQAHSIGEAEIALTLRDMVTRVEPGGRIEEHGLVVEWAGGGIRVLLAVALIEPEERT